jgi:Ca2+-binding RTX toxin-like protein
MRITLSILFSYERTLTMATISGTRYDNTLYGTSSGDAIYGLEGNDTLKGGGGADYLDGGAGIDTALYSDSTLGVAVNLATGRGYGGTAEGDTLVSIENVIGSNYNDTLIGTRGANELRGGEGNDVLKGGGGNDYLEGGYGNDILQSSGNSYGSGYGSSILDGGAGDDTFIGTTGLDTVIGGTGSDTLDFSNEQYGVRISLGDPLPSWESSHAQFSSIENLTGSQGGDILVGDSGTNVLRGLAGQDILIGGDREADVMYGGTDRDIYYVNNASNVVWEYAGEGGDTVNTSVSYALTAGSEIEQLNTTDPYGTAAINLTGNEFANEINGNAGDNIINGGGGADMMYGGKGNDTYIVDNPDDWMFENGIIVANGGGSEGFDTVLTSVSFDVGLYNEIEVLQATGTGNISLVGGQGSNHLIGNSGQNLLDGSYGADTFTGGGGLDVFRWTDIAHIGRSSFDAEIVTDFKKAEGDFLYFTPMDANETVAGNQDFTFIGTNLFTAPGQINTVTNGVDTFIQLNTNADPTVDGVIKVLGVHTVDASWFAL